MDTKSVMDFLFHPPKSAPEETKNKRGEKIIYIFEKGLDL